MDASLGTWLILMIVVVACGVIMALLMAQHSANRMDAGVGVPRGATVIGTYESSSLVQDRASTHNVRRAGPRILDESTVHRVDALVAHGDKVEAIKVLREHTGLSLAQAKERIDRWLEMAHRREVHGGQLELSDTDRQDILDMVHDGRRHEALQRLLSVTGISEAEAESVLDRPMTTTGPRIGSEPDLAEETRKVLSVQGKGQAIKMVRVRTGAGLLEAKEFVNRARRT